MTERYQVFIGRLPKDGMRDPEGETIARALQQLGFSGIRNPNTDVRVGKFISFEVEADNRQELKEHFLRWAQEEFGNPLLHKFEINVEKLQGKENESSISP